MYRLWAERQRILFLCPLSVAKEREGVRVVEIQVEIEIVTGSLQSIAHSITILIWRFWICRLRQIGRDEAHPSGFEYH